ncbi:hypothetical protein AVEN_78447-1 [Araneus ventricosus]|uniref:Uncharacterized protein n=1 Tax=Araneus ventricosus TaxID=182803 RepID=A0A4Y2APH9_ARAVE|nr:hypothetical protein AVEN_78447-1 [Araneus ventricosus]
MASNVAWYARDTSVYWKESHNRELALGLIQAASDSFIAAAPGQTKGRGIWGNQDRMGQRADVQKASRFLRCSLSAINLIIRTIFSVEPLFLSTDLYQAIKLAEEGLAIWYETVKWQSVE